jgi:hypothetical protein
MPNSEDQEMALYEAFVSDPDRRLIAPAQDGVPSVEFKFGGGWRECRIWEGYFDASLILLKAALRAPQADNLIFPALFDLRMPWKSPSNGTSDMRAASFPNALGTTSMC